MTLHSVRQGTGSPLLMVHGLGGHGASWAPIADALAAERELILIDLPGHGATPALTDPPSVAALTDAVETFMTAEGLQDVDMVGSSLGARITLELARRGKGGAVVALAPGGFWSPGQRRFFAATVAPSIRLVQGLNPLMPFLTGNPVTRTLLFPQFTPKPWGLPKEVALPEMNAFKASTAVKQTLKELYSGPVQEGMAKGSAKGPITLGWGRQDKVTLPSQAKVAQEKFPDAELHWFERCGHFPHWDQPEQTVELILAKTGAALAA